MLASVVQLGVLLNPFFVYYAAMSLSCGRQKERQPVPIIGCGVGVSQGDFGVSQTRESIAAAAESDADAEHGAHGQSTRAAAKRKGGTQRFGGHSYH